jgi:hypothetical protein
VPATRQPPQRAERPGKSSSMRRPRTSRPSWPAKRRRSAAARARYAEIGTVLTRCLSTRNLGPASSGGAFHAAIAFRPASVIFVQTTGFSRSSRAMRATLPVANPSITRSVSSPIVKPSTSSSASAQPSGCRARNRSARRCWGSDSPWIAAARRGMSSASNVRGSVAGGLATGHCGGQSRGAEYSATP